MNVVAIEAPIGSMEPAPITSLLIHMGMQQDRLSAFWTEQDQYVVRAEGDAGVRWYQIEAEFAASDTTDAERLAMGALLADIIPIGGGRVAFPVGSSGRQVYRVWRSTRNARGGRTTIRGVRAARSRRQPA